MTYAVGYLVGRLIITYTLVWLGCFGVAKLQYGRAKKYAHSKYGIATILVLFTFSLLSSLD